MGMFWFGGAVVGGGHFDDYRQLGVHDLVLEYGLSTSLALFDQLLSISESNFIG